MIGVGSLAAGSAAAMGTGAFSYVRADRKMEVNVTGDRNAYLRLESTSKYADPKNGKLELEFNGSNGQRGDGLNKNADSRFDHVFKIKNQGTNDVRVSIQHDSDDVHFYEGTDFSESGRLDSGPGNSLPVLAPGDEIKVSVIFWLRNNSDVDLPSEIGITAEEP